MMLKRNFSHSTRLSHLPRKLSLSQNTLETTMTWLNCVASKFTQTTQDPIRRLFLKEVHHLKQLKICVITSTLAHTHGGPKTD